MSDSTQTDNPEIFSSLQNIFRIVFDNPNLLLSPESNSKTIQGWDSFKFLDVIAAVEEEFGIELTAEEIDEITCVGAFAEIIASRG